MTSQATSIWLQNETALKASSIIYMQNDRGVFRVKRRGVSPSLINWRAYCFSCHVIVFDNGIGIRNSWNAFLKTTDKKHQNIPCSSSMRWGDHRNRNTAVLRPQNLWTQEGRLWIQQDCQCRQTCRSLPETDRHLQVSHIIWNIRPYDNSQNKVIR